MDAERAGVPNGRRAGEKFCHPGGAGEAIQQTGGAGRVKQKNIGAGRAGKDAHGGFRAGDSYGWDYDIIKYFKPNMFSQMDLYLWLNSSSYNSFVLQIYMKHISDHSLWVKINLEALLCLNAWMQ